MILSKYFVHFSCATKTEFRLPFQDTLFGQLHDLIQEINTRWSPLNGVF